MDRAHFGHSETPLLHFLCACEILHTHDENFKARIFEMYNILTTALRALMNSKLCFSVVRIICLFHTGNW